MSLAWQITDEDVRTVLQQHGRPADDEAVAAALALVTPHEPAIVDRLLSYHADMDEQTASMLDDIADILRAAGLIGPETLPPTTPA